MGLRLVDRPWQIVQLIKAGSQFTGEMPADGATPLTPTVTTGTWSFAYAAGTKGGLFDPTSTHYTFDKDEPLAVVGIQILFGGQSAWSLSIVNAAGDAAVGLSGTTETSLVHGFTDRWILTYGQKLKLTTTGASSAMSASIELAPVMFFSRW